MILAERIAALVYLGDKMQDLGGQWGQSILKAKQHNPWFTEENCKQSVLAVAKNYLSANTLKDLQTRYPDLESRNPKNIGLIAAGNIPLVGMHDIIACFLSGHKAIIKLSEKDAVLIPSCIETIVSKFPAAKDYFSFVNKLESFDAVIATGSNNTSRYFEYYFSKYPHIIRKNRNAIAVLSGKETKEELREFGKDVFSYFGLGCRNVSKVFVPRGYKLEDLMQAFEHFKEIAYHNKYRNNLDYNAAIYLLNKEPHLISDFLVMREAETMSSRIACLHYQYYDTLEEVDQYLADQVDNIQCVVSHLELKNAIPFAFGMAQSPEFLDYADNVDTLDFLQKL